LKLLRILDFSISLTRPQSRSSVFTLLLRAFALLPLRINHRVGAALGWIAYFADRRYARTLRDNLAQSGIARDCAEYKRLLRQNIAESGKAMTELFIAFLRPQAEVTALVTESRGWEHAEAALAKGRGVIFVTPHLGCFDIAGRYVASRVPVTFLYSPPKLRWAADLMYQGRVRGQATLAPADMRGVRSMLKTLKKGGNVCILPDQAPRHADGVWVDFFGRLAFTMTLVGRLQHATGAEVVLFYGERLRRGRGYRVCVEPLPEPLNADNAVAARQLNLAIESLVRRCPAQYFWSYNRYKVPAGAPPRPRASSSMERQQR
jgi:Kdo2-lipid IVA lauroyltransferase/acyltransferase